MSAGRRNSLIEIYNGGIRFFASLGASTYVAVRSLVAPASNIEFKLPSTLPGSTQAVVVDSAGQISYQAISGGGGTVTSIGVNAPSDLFTSSADITTAGDVTLSKVSQAANLVYGTGNSASDPTFRALGYTHVSSFVGTGASTIAAGNDSRFHTQNTDTGTTATAFQIDSGNSGGKIKNIGGAINLRNSADNAFADFAAGNTTINGNLTVSGTTFTVNSETLTIDDNIIVLNNNVTTGTPSEDGGVQVRRGSSASASMLWDETLDLWRFGIAGSEIRGGRTVVVSFANAQVTAGIATITHNLKNQYPSGVSIYDGSNKLWGGIDDVTATDADTLTLDVTSVVAANGGTLPGTWRCSVTG